MDKTQRREQRIATEEENRSQQKEDVIPRCSGCNKIMLICVCEDKSLSK